MQNYILTLDLSIYLSDTLLCSCTIKQNIFTNWTYLFFWLLFLIAMKDILCRFSNLYLAEFYIQTLALWGATHEANKISLSFRERAKPQKSPTKAIVWIFHANHLSNPRHAKPEYFWIPAKNPWKKHYFWKKSGVARKRALPKMWLKVPAAQSDTSFVKTLPIIGWSSLNSMPAFNQCFSSINNINPAWSYNLVKSASMRACEVEKYLSKTLWFQYLTQVFTKRFNKPQRWNPPWYSSRKHGQYVDENRTKFPARNQFFPLFPLWGFRWPSAISMAHSTIWS